MKCKFLMVFLMLFLVCYSGCLFKEGYPDILYKKYNVVKIINTTIENKNVIIVYQIKSKFGPLSNVEGLDVDSKRDIVAICYYVFKNTNADEVQIICFYPEDSNLVVLYKFKIDRRNAELAELFDISPDQIDTYALYKGSRLIALGQLWVNKGLAKKLGLLT
ncbi:hypothetical protein [Methanocaldococcus infernus]